MTRRNCGYLSRDHAIALSLRQRHPLSVANDVANDVANRKESKALKRFPCLVSKVQFATFTWLEDVAYGVQIACKFTDVMSPTLS